MKKVSNIVIVVVLVLAIGFVLWNKNCGSGTCPFRSKTAVIETGAETKTCDGICSKCSDKANCPKQILPTDTDQPTEKSAQPLQDIIVNESKNADVPLVFAAKIKAKPALAIQTPIAEAAKVVEKIIEPAIAPAKEVKVVKLARLVELGSDRCVPCKMMKPILAELETAYESKLLVEFYDVWKNLELGKKYGVRVIPTQIFYNTEGKEFFRHEGFYPKNAIIAKFKEFGIDLNKAK